MTTPTTGQESADEIDPELFDRFVAPLDPPLLIVTTAHEDERSGCVVGFASQCSIEPRRYAIWLSKANHTFKVALLAEWFAVHVVDEANRELAELFGGTTGDEIDKFERCGWTAGPGGVPLLDDIATRMVGRRAMAVDDGSDHVCITLEPHELRAPGDVVVLRASTLDVTPAHEATDVP